MHIQSKETRPLYSFSRGTFGPVVGVQLLKGLESVVTQRCGMAPKGVPNCRPKDPATPARAMPKVATAPLAAAPQAAAPNASPPPSVSVHEISHEELQGHPTLLRMV